MTTAPALLSALGFSAIGELHAEFVVHQIFDGGGFVGGEGEGFSDVAFVGFEGDWDGGARGRVVEDAVDVGPVFDGFSGDGADDCGDGEVEVFGIAAFGDDVEGELGGVFADGDAELAFAFHELGGDLEGFL